MKIVETKTEQTIIDDTYHKIITPDGVVWMQKGFNPDRVYGEKSGNDWPYSKVVAALICQQVIEGKGLVEISKQEGYPEYKVIVSWKKKPEFATMLRQAFRDKAEYHAERAIAIATTGRGDKILFDALKWSATSDNPEKYSANKKTNKTVQPIKFEIKEK